MSGLHGRIASNDCRRLWKPFRLTPMRRELMEESLPQSPVRDGRRGKRAIDLLIAATAVPAGLPLYTRNIDGFGGLEGVVDIVEVRG